MKIEKLELKHLFGYPKDENNGLLIQTNKRKKTKSGKKIGYYTGRMIGLSIRTGVEIVFNVEDFAEDFDLDEIKPLLLPLSSLTEPLEDGTVPIVELAKMAGLKSSEYTIEEQDGTLVLFGKEIRYPGSSNAAKFFFEIEIDNCDMDKGIEFSDPYSYDFSPLNNQLQLFEYLYSIHADIYGLISAGLAIDKRTVKL